MRVIPFSYLEQLDKAVVPPVTAVDLFFLADNDGAYNSTTFENVLKTDVSGSIDTTFNNALTNANPFNDGRGGYGSTDDEFLYVAMYNNINQLKIFKINKTTGVVVATSSTTYNNNVFGVTVNGDYLYITGLFTNVNGTNRINRLNKSDLSDASSSTLFGTGFNGTTFGKAIAFDSSYMYIGGDFSSYDGSSANLVAKIDLSTGNLDSTFQSNISGESWSNRLRALKLYDGNLYLGIWHGVGAYSRTTTGTDNTAFSAGTGFVGSNGGRPRDIAIDGNGRICYVGEFSAYDSTTVGGCAVLQTDGSLYPTFHNGSGTEFGTSFNGRAGYHDGKWYFAKSNQATANNWDGTSYSNPISVNDDGTINDIFNNGVTITSLTFITIG